MLFNSLPFLAFIVLFFALWPYMQKRNTSKWLWICTMSFLFYGWWDWRFLFLLLGTGSIDYLAGYLIIRDASRKKMWLWLSLTANIASLVIFKYSEWFASMLDQAFGWFNIHTAFQASVPEFTLVLPVGVSFYTFNSMSYTIDLYRGKSQPAKNILHFFAFISFFPHLVAGPIIRARDILSQLYADKKADAVEILHGIKTCIWGFFQKMVLADNLAVYVNEQFNDVYAHDGSFGWWICMLAFTFQIYFDFNGYSTIARGIAKLCGIHFRLNFNHPYLAASFRDFWQRWHISLSSFFRDYVYIPLGGNRRGRVRSMLNTWITMLLSGLWHGANLTFIAWGALHAFYLTVERLFSGILRKGRSMVLWGRLIVFPSVLLAWVFFRSAYLRDAIFIIKRMLQFNGESDIKSILTGNIAIWLFLAILLEFTSVFKFRIGQAKHIIVQVLFWSIVVSMIIYLRGPDQQFIYFQF